MKPERRSCDRFSTLYTHAGGVGDEAELESVVLGLDTIVEGHGVRMQRCKLNRSIVIRATDMQVSECEWTTVDAANADIERSGWRDTLVLESRFTGTRINSAYMKDLVFEACRMTLMQCQQATLQRVRFERCDLRGAYFNGTVMPGTVFEGSDLTGADFSGATIASCDFRRAVIEDIRIAPGQVAGVIVTSDQALYLARLFGLVVEE